MMTTQKQPIDGITLGLKFKTAREQMKLSLEEVHSRLRIHFASLQNIEKGEFNDWPGGSVYGKSFVKKYAEFLKLNSAEIMSEFDQLGLVTRKVDLEVGTQKSNREGTKIKFAWVMMRKYKKFITYTLLGFMSLVVVVALVMGMINLFHYMVGGFGNKKSEITKKEVKAQPVSSGTESNDTKKSIAKEKPVKPSVDVAANKKDVPATIKAKEDNKVEFLNSPGLGNYPNIRKGDPLILEILATTDVWMKVVADDKTLFEEILKKGQRERWIADNDIVAKFGRPEGVSLMLNGFSLGKPGNGQSKHVKMTRFGMAEA